MTAPQLLVLDLGDIVTKGVAVWQGRRQRLRFPSATARRLVNGGAEAASLLLDGSESFPRPESFEPLNYPRIRSYSGAEEFLGEVRSKEHPVLNARFAGWLAAAYGSDRQLLGMHPNHENIDLLVRKALILTAAECGDVDVVLVVDIGPKAEAILRYADSAPREIALDTWSFLHSKRNRVKVSVRTRVVDAAACAETVVPPQVALAQVRRLLLIDIGYLRTKLAIVSAEGCEYQEQVQGLGVSDCVRRVLRDGQDQGLVEDEFAVVRALEKSQGTIDVAGRRFEIGVALASASRALGEELANAAHRIVLEHFNRRGETCGAVAIFGGGAALVGHDLADRLGSREPRLASAWVADDPSFLLVNGARQLERHTPC